MPESIEGRSRELLQEPNFCQVATIRKDGTPHVVPTWIDVDGELVVLNTASGRFWERNLQRDPRVTLTINNRENPYEYVTIRGTVAEKTAEGADDHIDRMAKKYLGQDTYPMRQAGEQRVMVKITPEKVTHRGQ